VLESSPPPAWLGLEVQKLAEAARLSPAAVQALGACNDGLEAQLELVCDMLATGQVDGPGVGIYLHGCSFDPSPGANAPGSPATVPLDTATRYLRRLSNELRGLAGAPCAGEVGSDDWVDAVVELAWRRGLVSERQTGRLRRLRGGTKLLAAHNVLRAGNFMQRLQLPRNLVATPPLEPAGRCRRTRNGSGRLARDGPAGQPDVQSMGGAAAAAAAALGGGGAVRAAIEAMEDEPEELAELRELVRGYGLPTDGDTATLMQRLIEYVAKLDDDTGGDGEGHGGDDGGGDGGDDDDAGAANEGFAAGDDNEGFAAGGGGPSGATQHSDTVAGGEFAGGAVGGGNCDGSTQRPRANKELRAATGASPAASPLASPLADPWQSYEWLETEATSARIALLSAQNGAPATRSAPEPSPDLGARHVVAAGGEKVASRPQLVASSVDLPSPIARRDGESR
jgi:hypothetical protein